MHRRCVEGIGMYTIFVLITAALERAGSFLGGRKRGPGRGGSADPRRIAPFAIPFYFYPIALVALSLAFSALVDHARALQGAAPPNDLPYDFLYLRDKRWEAAYKHVAPLILLDVALQSIVLGALFIRARSAPLSRVDLGVAGAAVVALVVTALGRRLLESTDMYNYFTYAHLGMAKAYGTAIAIDDPGLRRVTDLTWGVLPPSPYGPLWHLYNRAIMNVPSLADATLRLRVVNTVVLLGLFGGLLAARIPIAAVLVFALNPYVYQQFVVNAHNDLLPIAALTLGCAFAYRSPWPLVVATALAGLVKLPLLLVGVATLGTIASLPKRLVALTAIVAVDLALSFVLGGQPYVHALLFAAEADKKETLLHAILVVLGLGSIALAFFTRRQYWPGLLALPALRAFNYPWYLIWLMPIAIARRTDPFPIAVMFPIVGVLLSDVYFGTRAMKLAIYALIAIAVAATVALERRPRFAGPLPRLGEEVAT